MDEVEVAVSSSSFPPSLSPARLSLISILAKSRLTWLDTWLQTALTPAPASALLAASLRILETSLFITIPPLVDLLSAPITTPSQYCIAQIVVLRLDRVLAKRKRRRRLSERLYLWRVHRGNRCCRLKESVLLILFFKYIADKAPTHSNREKYSYRAICVQIILLHRVKGSTTR